MKRLAVVLAWVSALVIAPIATGAQEPVEETIHVVQPGETLGEIAARYFDDGARWRDIYEANRDVIADPNRIAAGMELVIPGVAEAPPLGRGVGEDAAAAVQDEPSLYPSEGPRRIQRTRFYEEAAGTRPEPPPGRTRFYLENPAAQVELDGGEPTVLSEDLDVRAPVKAPQFYAAPWLQDAETLRPYGELIKVLQSPETFGRETEVAHQYGEIFLSYHPDRRPEVGQRLVLTVTGRSIGEYGEIIHPTAIIRVTALEADVIVATVRSQFGPVGPGQVAIDPHRYPDFAGGTAEPVENGAEGEIIAFEQEQDVYGQSDIAFISLGPGVVQPGDELMAFIPDRAVSGRTEHLPPEPVASMVVVRLGERSATIRVSDVRHAVLDVGSPLRVVRKMP